MGVGGSRVVHDGRLVRDVPVWEDVGRDDCGRTSFQVANECVAERPMKTSIRTDTKLWVFEQESGERIYVFGYTWFEARGGALAALQQPSAMVTGHEIGNIKDHLVEAGSTIVCVDRGSTWFEIVETLRRMSGEEVRKLLAFPSPFEDPKPAICKDQFTDHLDGGRFYVCNLPAGHGGEQHTCGDVGWPMEVASVVSAEPVASYAHPSAEVLRARLRAEADYNEDWPEMGHIASQAIDALAATEVQFSLSFEDAWKVKAAEGYQYGRDALEQVRFGWDLRKEMDSGRRQDKSDGGGRVHGVHDQDGSHHLRRSAEQAGTDNVGAVGTGHPESSGLLAGSGESDAEDSQRVVSTCTCIEGNDMTLTTTAVVNCAVHGTGRATTGCIGCDGTCGWGSLHGIGSPEEWEAARGRISELVDEVAGLKAEKDAGYEERNRLVALFASMALALGWKAGVGQHEDEPGKEWDADWRTLILVETPEGQASWHFHDSQNHLVKHLPSYVAKWDGHDTPTKYARLEQLMYRAATGTHWFDTAEYKRGKSAADEVHIRMLELRDAEAYKRGLLDAKAIALDVGSHKNHYGIAVAIGDAAAKIFSGGSKCCFCENVVPLAQCLSCTREKENTLAKLDALLALQDDVLKLAARVDATRQPILVGQDMTRNPTTEEELARVRSELNHYRDKYLNDDRIPIANAEIIRLESVVEQMVTRLEAADWADDAVTEEREACAMVCGAMADFLANIVSTGQMEHERKLGKVSGLQEATERIRARTKTPVILPTPERRAQEIAHLEEKYAINAAVARLRPETRCPVEHPSLPADEEGGYLCCSPAGHDGDHWCGVRGGTVAWPNVAAGEVVRHETVAIREIGGCGAIAGTKPHERACILPMGHPGLHGWEESAESSVVVRLEAAQGGFRAVVASPHDGGFVMMDAMDVQDDAQFYVDSANKALAPFLQAEYRRGLLKGVQECLAAAAEHDYRAKTSASAGNKDSDVRYRAKKNAAEECARLIEALAKAAT